MSTIIPVDIIKISENRQRQQFEPGALNELRESIERNGLMQAPVIRFREGKVWLVAGERRLRAILDLYELGGTFKYDGEPVPPNHVPVISMGELAPLDAWEAELEENIRRQDLTWQERAKAEANLMELRSQQAIKAGRPLPTTTDIAKELNPLLADRPLNEIGSYGNTVRENVIVARHLADPEVNAAATARDAMKILKKREALRQNEALAAHVGKTFSAGDHALHNADCIEWMREAASDQFDIILTDPPYGMGAHEFGDMGRTGYDGTHGYEDTPELWTRLMAEFPQLIYRLAKPEAHAYVFCDPDKFPTLRELMGRAGWRVFRTPLIWANPAGFRAPWPEHGPQRKYEMILYAVKGGRKVTAIYGDVLGYAREARTAHMAQKPLPLLLDLLRRSALPGDRVLDPFVGSGSAIEACHELKLTCTGLEIDPASYAIAMKRLESLGAAEKGLF